MNNRRLSTLPLSLELETKAVLRLSAKAHAKLGELKGLVQSIPNEAIILNTLALQEAKSSSEVENIITTDDELFRADAGENLAQHAAAKEVQRYSEALQEGLRNVRSKGVITLSDVLAIQAQIELNRAGLRKLPGTVLKNQQSGETVYTPPQHPDEVVDLMQNWVEYLNVSDELDPLVKMAVLHHQFESIHPFYDGNGRTGRVLNLLYLVKVGLLDLPVLYLSRYFVEHKQDYYAHLQNVRENNDWEAWVLYVLRGIETTAGQTIRLVKAIKGLMQAQKKRLREELPNLYSQDLLNLIFRHPYTKISFMQEHLEVSRQTASSYLKQMVDKDILRLEKRGRSNYYLNQALLDLFQSEQWR